jgi:hypothetical protein
MRPAKIIKKLVTRDTLACRCSKTMVSEHPPKRFGKRQFDASVAASLVAGKCDDCIPVCATGIVTRASGSLYQSREGLTGGELWQARFPKTRISGLLLYR